MHVYLTGISRGRLPGGDCRGPDPGVASSSPRWRVWRIIPCRVSPGAAAFVDALFPVLTAVISAAPVQGGRG
jgi:hypothetical protein